MVIQVTPYHLMKKGLAIVAVSQLIYNLSILDKINNRDQLLRNEICSAINQALTRNDLIEELKDYFFTKGKFKSSSEVLLSTMFKTQNYISNEKIQILLTLGKNFPEVLTLKWLEDSNKYKLPQI